MCVFMYELECMLIVCIQKWNSLIIVCFYYTVAFTTLYYSLLDYVITQEKYNISSI